MDRRLRVSLSSFIVLSIAGLAIMVLVHYRSKNTFKVTLTPDKKFGVQIDRVHYSGTKAGRVEWELDAESAKRSKDEDLLMLDRVKLTFYAKDGAKYLLTSLKGDYKESAAEVNVNGDVRVVSLANGATLTTDSLKYSMKTRTVTTSSRVRITSKDKSVDGTGLVAEMESEKFRILKDVHAVF